MGEDYYKKLGFKEDPYSIRNPEGIEFKFIEWNREDWQNVKEKLEVFLSDVRNGYITGMRLFGAWGSGKTWLIRYIQKELKDENIFPMYTKVLGIDPSFGTLYQVTIEYVIGKKDVIIAQMKKRLNKDSLTLKDYIELFKDEDLGKCLYEAFVEGNNRAFAEKWLKGEKLSTDEIKALKLINQNDSDYKRSKTLQNIIGIVQQLFSSVILFIDQLEVTSPKLARVLSDLLRDYLDSYTEKFALVCSLQAEQEDAWYDIGFTDALLSRLRYSLVLPSFTESSVSSFLKKHHEMYSSKKEHGLYPFTEDGLKYLFRSTLPERRYPRNLFIQCAFLAKKMSDDGEKEINPEFIKKYFSSIEFLSEQSRLP